MRIQSLIFSIIMLMPAAGWAQQKGISVKSLAEVEIAQTNAQGEKIVKRSEAAKSSVGPGDTVIFTSVYTNTGKQSAADVVISNPVPEHMFYLDQTAEGSGTRIEFSANRGKTFGAQNAVTVKGADGIVRKALAKEYTHIRWTLLAPLASGATGTVSYRAKVE